MPLTHACVWESKIGYRHISIDEACEKYPTTVSAAQGFFICGLCGQKVGLTKKYINTGKRHFYHSSKEQDKTCEDRANSLYQPLSALNNHSMPLRLSITGSTFTLQIGFFNPPDSEIRCDAIKITTKNNQQYIYSFDRIEVAGTTYLNVGSLPSQSYSIEYVKSNENLKKYWSMKSTGINPSGAIFDGRTKRMLQPGAKAYSKNTYYLLCRKKLSYHRDLDISEIAKVDGNLSSSWYLYEIHVKNFSQDAARFFLVCGIFLTEKPVDFFPVWPPYIEDSYFIRHNSEKVFFYMNGEDAELKSYPANSSVFVAEEGRLYRITTREKEQLVSFGRTGALGFSYLLKQPLNTISEEPSIIIRDIDGKEISEDKFSETPKGKLISIVCRFDGKVVIKRNGIINHVYRLLPDQPVSIEHIVFGTEIYLYQGCDHVRTLRFNHNDTKHINIDTDDMLVKKLKMCRGDTIPVTHAMGSIMQQYENYPHTKLWLLKVLRKGEITRSAYHLLIKH